MVAKVGTFLSILIPTESPEFLFYSGAVKNNHPVLPDISIDGVKHIQCSGIVIYNPYQLRVATNSFLDILV